MTYLRRRSYRTSASVMTSLTLTACRSAITCRRAHSASETRTERTGVGFPRGMSVDDDATGTKQTLSGQRLLDIGASEDVTRLSGLTDETPARGLGAVVVALDPVGGKFLAGLAVGGVHGDSLGLVAVIRTVPQPYYGCLVFRPTNLERVA
jgi:hypothetical protein